MAALQESDGPSWWSGGFDHVQALADSSGLPHQFRGAHIQVGIGRWGVNCGTALLANRPLIGPQSRVFPSEAIGAKGFVWAEVPAPGGAVRVASVHLHPSEPAIRARQADLLVKTLADAPRPLIVMGDLNCDRDEPAFTTITEGLGLRSPPADASGLATYPSRNPALRIDWILVSPELEFVHYVICGGLESDHRAVRADLRWRAGAPRSRTQARASSARARSSG